MVSLQKDEELGIAPANPRMLAEEGIDFAFTSQKIEKRNSSFISSQTAISHGLSQKKPWLH